MDDGFDLTAELARVAEEAKRAAATTPEEQLELVKAHCLELTAREELSADDRLVLARAFVSGLSINVRDAELLRYLAGGGPEVGEPISHIPIALASSRGAWGDLLLDHSLNLITAAPKVGKSALLCHLYAAARRGSGECLGQRIRKPWNRLIISGNDMSAAHWGKILIREGLAKHIPDPDDPEAPGSFLPDPDILIWDQGNPARMNTAGIAAMKAKCLEFPDSLLIIDSLRSNVDPAIDENKAEIRGPIEALKEAMDECIVTIALVHHTNKSVSGSTAISAAAGNNAISGACDGTLLLKYLSPDPASGFRSDRRVLASSSGRSRDGKALIELTTDGIGQWIHHGDMDGAMQEEAVYEMEEKLTSRQSQIYEHAEELAEMDRFITVKEVMGQFNLTRMKARKTLEQLARKGLVVRCGTEATGTAGREAIRYAPALSSLARTKEPPSRAGRSERGVLITPIIPIRELEPLGTQEPRAGTSPREVGIHPDLPPTNTPVERCVDGVWNNGWKLHPDTSHPDAVIIWTVLKGRTLLVRNLRWGLDVRLCQAPTLPAPINLDDLPF